MKKIKELLETIFSSANQRIKSPFFGFFIISWLIVNWKPIFYFVLSDDKISIKINKIEKSYEFIQNSLLLPLLFSFIYVVVFPYMNQFIHWLTIKAEDSKRNEQHKLRKKQIGYSQELAQQEKALEDIRSGNKDISQLNEKISLLNKDNERLKETIQNKDEAISDYGEQLDKVTSEAQNLKQELLSKKTFDGNVNIESLVEYENFKQKEMSVFFPEIVDNIFSNGGKLMKIQNKVITFYLDNKIIEFDSLEPGTFDLTEKGNIFWGFYKINNKNKD